MPLVRSLILAVLPALVAGPLCAEEPASGAAPTGAPAADPSAGSGQAPAVLVALRARAAPFLYDPGDEPEPAFEMTPEPPGLLPRAWTEYRVRFPSALESPDPLNNSVPCALMLPAAPTDRCMILFPFYTETTLLATKTFFGRAFVEAGPAVAIMPLAYQVGRVPEGEKPGLRFAGTDLDDTRRNWRQSELDAGRFKRWLRARWGFRQFGLFGISLGAVVGAHLFALDAEFQVGVFLIGGGNVHDALWLDALGFGPGATLRAQGMSYDEVRALTEDLDPLTFAPLARPRKDGLLLYNALEDEVIPPRNSRALWAAFGRPEMRWVPGRHRQSAVHWLRETDACAAFARDAFARAAARDAEEQEF